MKYSVLLLLALLTLSTYGCSTAKNSTTTENNLEKELIEKNKGNITLLQRIRQKNGVIVRGQVPIINKAANSFESSGSQEPLYVLNKQVIGNSFASVNEIVDSFNVKDITILTGSQASIYGTQGANGVILITTYSSN